MKTLISLLLTLTYGYFSADGAKLKDLSKAGRYQRDVY